MRTASVGALGAPEGSAPAPAALGAPGGALGNLSSLLGSHLVVGLVGLACLPVLARNLGPAGYGRLSLFVLALGLLSNLDPVRPVLVRELARDRATGDLRPLALAGALVLAPLALGVGLFAFTPLVAAGLAAAVALHALASPPYAALAACGRVGTAGAVRNGFWTLALLLVLAASFHPLGRHAWVVAFAGANLAILVALRRLAPPTSAPPAPRRSAFALLARHRAACTDVALFALASAVVVGVDRVLLQRHVDEETFGRYAAQVDVVVKINIVSTALGTILLPALSRVLAEQGHAEAARRFVRASSWIALAYFAALACAIAFHEELVALLLGPRFAGASDVMVLVLVAVFVHLFGFLITPWQRACGDWRTHRRAYFVAAVVCASVAVAAIPSYGVRGALAAYLCGRLAELALVVVEVRRLDASVLPRWRVAALAAMVLALVGLGAHELSGAGLV